MIQDAALLLSVLLKERCRNLVAAESCTSGMISVALAGIPGASGIFWGSLVCYSNDAKQRVLGVDGELLRNAGPVSGEVALAMAEGALALSGADFSVATTGIAGPEGDGTGVPVGTVWIAVAGGRAPGGVEKKAVCHHYGGDRNAVRDRAAEDALLLVASRIRGTDGTEAETLLP